MPDLEQQLAKFLTETYGPVELSEINRISDGWENDVYSFIYRPADTQFSEMRILRIYPGDNALEKSTHEFSGMKLLHETGFPVPEVLFHTPDAFHKPAVIMEFIEGVPLAQAFEYLTEHQTDAMKHECVELFVRLHTLDVTSFLTPDLPASTFDDRFWFIQGLMQQAERIISGPLKEPFAPVMDWLRDHKQNAPCERPSITHGDYHFRNVLCSSDSKLVVIDWTNWQIGDYRYDLAWTLLLLSTYGYPDLAENFLESYERISGQPVEQLEYYEVIAATRRLLDILMVFYAGAESWGLRPEAGDLIRKYPDHIWAVYKQLCDRTNLQFDAIQAMIKPML